MQNLFSDLFKTTISPKSGCGSEAAVSECIGCDDGCLSTCIDYCEENCSDTNGSGLCGNCDFQCGTECYGECSNLITFLK